MNWTEKKKYIEQIDFSATMNKLAGLVMPQPYGYTWDYQSVHRAVCRYRKYLFILVKYRDQYKEIPPTFEIDEIWHNHILDTRQYTENCEVLYGEYIHHNPWLFMKDDKTQDFEKMFRLSKLMRRLFLDEFGEELTEPKQAEAVAWMKARGFT